MNPSTSHNQRLCDSYKNDFLNYVFDREAARQTKEWDARRQPFNGTVEHGMDKLTLTASNPLNMSGTRRARLKRSATFARVGLGSSPTKQRRPASGSSKLFNSRSAPFLDFTLYGKNMPKAGDSTRSRSRRKKTPPVRTPTPVRLSAPRSGRSPAAAMVGVNDGLGKDAIAARAREAQQKSDQMVVGGGLIRRVKAVEKERQATKQRRRPQTAHSGRTGGTRAAYQGGTGNSNRRDFGGTKAGKRPSTAGTSRPNRTGAIRPSTAGTSSPKLPVGNVVLAADATPQLSRRGTSSAKERVRPATAGGRSTARSSAGKSARVQSNDAMVNYAKKPASQNSYVHFVKAGGKQRPMTAAPLRTKRFSPPSSPSSGQPDNKMVVARVSGLRTGSALSKRQVEQGGRASERGYTTLSIRGKSKQRKSNGRHGTKRAKPRSHSKNAAYLVNANKSNRGSTGGFCWSNMYRSSYRNDHLSGSQKFLQYNSMYNPW